ncbi:MAG: phage minor head protein [Planctomycetota bacterium]|jgi:hypothetical protein
MTFIFRKPGIKSAIRRFLEKARRPLDSDERKIQRVLLKAVEDIRDATKRAELRAALEAGNLEAALASIPFDAAQDALARLKSIYMGTFSTAAERAARSLRRRMLEAKGLRFDLLNPRSVDWIDRNAARLIREFGSSSQEAIRNLIRQAFDEGIPPRATARLIRQTGIGLTDRQSKAVLRFRDRLMRDAAEGRIRATQGQIAARVERYARKQLRRRTETIARTETMFANNAGQIELWNQAADKGLIDRSQAQLVWLTHFDERTCEICAPMDGMAIDMGGSFDVKVPGVDGSILREYTAMHPPAHPSCRCETILDPDGGR